jgi:hypothetical protein
MPRKSRGTRVNKATKPMTLPVKFIPGFLGDMDRRTELAKTLKANYATIINDVGGPSEVGHVKAALIERFVWLEAIVQTLEHEMASGAIEKAEHLGRWIQAVNSLSGLAKALGVERKLAERPWLSPAAPVQPTNDDDGEASQ